jgi:hypothetical protein
MRIQAIDIVQPPGISMPGIADMEPHQIAVTEALTTKASAETANNARSGLRVFVMTLPPHAGFVASERRAIEPLIRTP